MSDSHVRFLSERQRHQLCRPNARSRHLQDSALAPVTPHNLARKSVKLQELADLVRIPRSQDNLVPSCSEFLNNRQEEGDVWGVVQINPYLLWLHGAPNQRPLLTESIGLTLLRQIYTR